MAGGGEQRTRDEARHFREEMINPSELVSNRPEGFWKCGLGCDYIAVYLVELRKCPWFWKIRLDLHLPQSFFLGLIFADHYFLYTASLIKYTLCVPAYEL